MKDYTLFTVNEFVIDEDFQSWVLRPDDDTQAFWANWLEAHPDRAEEVDDARRLLQSIKFASYNLAGEDVSQLWGRIKDTGSQKNRNVKTSFFKIQSWHSVAAAVLFMAIASVLWLSRTATMEYHTAFGETRTIVLPDSSTVVLNSNSSLKLASNWNEKSTRQVWLEGEAFFSVIHKVNHQPFRVSTGKDVAIDVLGTTFNVYNRTSNTKVVLNTGQIRLSLPTINANKKILMKPGELVEYNEKKYIKRQVNPRLYTAWTEKNIILNHTSMREMIGMVKDNYGIDIEVGDHLLDQTISGSMPVTNADSLIQQIAKAFRLKVVKIDNKIYIKE